MYVSKEDARKAVNEMQGKILNKRTLTVSIAADNGRAAEFIRRRVYLDKSKCYECGEDGHLSYECPRNQLGPRERPVPKKVRRGQVHGGGEGLIRLHGEDDELDGGDRFEDDSWASVVDTRGVDERLNEGERLLENRGKKEKKLRYLSDADSDDD